MFKVFDKFLSDRLNQSYIKSILKEKEILRGMTITFFLIKVNLLIKD